jgi:SAM-dependent methyltransferase
VTKRKKPRSPKPVQPDTRATASAPPLLAELDLLWQRRQPYAELLTEIVAETLEESGLTSELQSSLPIDLPIDLPILEIGAGTGQLRAWLPSALRERTVHTDPSQAALHALRERAPDAKTRVASAEHLPFPDGACGGVLGLCAFDALQDPGAAVAEIGRVLAPHGRFLHFMDMATLLEAPFAKLATSGLVPIPNVFGDPGDHEWPLDIVLVKRDWLAGLRHFAAGIAHPLSIAFAGYLAAFVDQPFDVQIATSIFKSIASSGEHRRALMTQLESAARLASAAGHPPIEPLAFHSGRYLQSVIETSFRDSGRFSVELSRIVSRSRWVPRGSAQEPRYRSLSIGHQRILDDFPRRFLTRSAEMRAQGHPPPTERLIEVGVFAFVAKRV